MPENHDSASRQDLNGLGSRLNSVTQDVARHEEAIKTSKQDRRDLWDNLNKAREEIARIEREAKERDVATERLINAVSMKVAGISAIFSIITTVAVALVVHALTKGAHP